jgi:hypothetical protein
MSAARPLARTARLVALLLALALAGCSKQQEATTAPEVHLPPDVLAVFPPARSTGVYYQTEIWAEFAEPLDSSTVNTKTVFLKLDTQRVPVTVTYESASRRIRLTLRALLQLRRTYTVELTPGIATLDGRQFSETWFWQFGTNSTRTPATPHPLDGVSGESPFALLQWVGTETAAGDIAYTLFRGTDSVAVAAHAADSVTLIRTPYYLPQQRWDFGVTMYWMIATLNRSTGEERDGPVWRFATVSASAPIDSITMNPTIWAFIRSGTSRATCSSGAFTTGPAYNCVLRFPLETVASTVRLARAELVLTPAVTTNLPSRVPTIWATLDDVTSCSIGFPGPPAIDDASGPLAFGELVNTEGRDRFNLHSDALTAHLQATIRRQGFHGYALRSAVQTSWTPPYGSEFDFRLRLYYFRDQP